MNPQQLIRQNGRAVRLMVTTMLLVGLVYGLIMCMAVNSSAYLAAQRLLEQSTDPEVGKVTKAQFAVWGRAKWSSGSPDFGRYGRGTFDMVIRGEAGWVQRRVQVEQQRDGSWKVTRID